ncbi:CCN family member 1-like [Leuresthes tenuis]|uniref:CCN family member 1-like n=1 Tax=Leuresthes tenuis TaxID=355514 RepID=UPI003B505551
MWKVFALVILCSTLVSASCPTDCQCPPEVPVCPTGVSLLMDSCGCCKVCARQLFEDCSKTHPCDSAKGLGCNFGSGFDSVKGVCRAKSDGRTCEFNSRIYQNGEIFRPNCKHQCTCMDGSVGCISLCPNELSLPKLSCVKPRRVKVLGQCCDQLICPENAKTDKSMKRKHNRKHRKDKTPEDDLTKKNELVPAWGEFESLHDVRSHSKGHMLSRGVQCLPQTTAWSPCSRSCGTGVSTRLTNNNIKCKLLTETRICGIKPCKLHTPKKAEKCNHTGKVIHPVKLSYAGCRSLRKFQSRHCGSCSDGRCCRPHRTQTVSVHFQCKSGETFRRKVMMTESCKCDFNCSSSNETPRLYRLFNDIHNMKL